MKNTLEKSAKVQALIDCYSSLQKSSIACDFIRSKLEQYITLKNQIEKAEKEAEAEATRMEHVNKVQSVIFWASPADLELSTSESEKVIAEAEAEANERFHAIAVQTNEYRMMSPAEKATHRRLQAEQALEKARVALAMAEIDLQAEQNFLAMLSCQKGRSKEPLKTAIKLVKESVKRKVQRRNELWSLHDDCKVTMVSTTSESWDMLDNAYNGDTEARAFLNICEIIAYSAVKARVVSVSAALAKSKHINDGKNHREKFYQTACNAGCDKAMLNVLAEFSFRPMGAKAQDIVSTVYTNLIDAHSRFSKYPTARNIPMFLVGMRYAWQAMNREKGAQVKIGTGNKNAKDGAFRVYVQNVDYSKCADASTVKKSGVHRVTEEQAERNIFWSEIENFISRNSDVLKKSHVDMLSAIQAGVSVREYAKSICKDKKVVQRMIFDVQKIMQKIDTSENCKNHREKTFLDFLDVYMCKNQNGSFAV